MQQPVRHKSTQPQQQPVAPQHSHHAQRTPQHRVLQADVAVQVEFFIRVVPPFAVVQPLQQFCREPLHHCSREHTGYKQRHGLCTHICKAYCHQDGRGAVDKAERPRRHTAVCKPLAPEGGHHGLPYPPKEGIDQIQHAQRVEVQCHRAFLAFCFYALIVLACAGLYKGVVENVTIGVGFPFTNASFPPKRAAAQARCSGSRSSYFTAYSWLLYSSTISSTLVSRGLPGRQASA